MSGLRDLWTARSPRERLMLGVLAAVLGGVVLWLALEGLSGWRDAAEARAERAALDHAEVLAGAALAGRAREQASAEGLEALVRRTAGANGFEPDLGAPGPDGAVTVSLDTAASPAVFVWLAQLEAQGVRVTAFTALKNPDATLQVRVTLAPAT